jgi:hypothetical protein
MLSITKNIYLHLRDYTQQCGRNGRRLGKEEIEIEGRKRERYGERGGESGRREKD